MKQNISIEDLNSLNPSQKQTLNSFWLPARYDRVVASVCKDVENDIYENLDFVVGEIILSESGTITLRRLRLQEEMVIDEENSLDDETEFDEEAYDMAEFDAGDYFLKENCLPLLNIGQLIHYIRCTKAGQDGFSLDIPPVNDVLLEQDFIINDRFGEVDKAEELVDLLFRVLKEQL